MTEKKKKIVLINPPRYELIPIHATRDIPYGLLKIGGYLLEQGHDVTLINGMEDHIDLSKTYRRIKCGNYENEEITREMIYIGMPLPEIRKRLQQIKNPDEIWVSSTMTYYWRAVHEVIDIAKEVHPAAKVLLGGIYASICREHAKKSKADVIYHGPYLPAEKSRTALELLSKIRRNFIIKYTRGCPHNCSYCAVTHLEGHKMEWMETEKFVEELEEKYNLFGIEFFNLWESNLLVNAKNRFEKVLDKIIEKRLPAYFRFPEGLQPSLVYPELAWKMKKAAVLSFALPLESADEELYDRFHKPSTLKHFDRSVSIFKKAGFRPEQISVFVLVGMPGQTIESIVKSDFKVLGMNCYLSNLRFTPIPGTEEYENHKEFLKDKTLEDLHPAAYPFANPKMTVNDLETVLSLNKKTDLYALLSLPEGTVKETFKELIRKHVVDEKESGKDHPKDIQIIKNAALFLEKDASEKLVEKLCSLRSSGKHPSFYVPVPRCNFNHIRKQASRHEIPAQCSKCLKLFTEGCEYHPPNQIKNAEYKINAEKPMRSMCAGCIHRLRGLCTMKCAQLENENE